jgi:hypothetical protein
MKEDKIARFRKMPLMKVVEHAAGDREKTVSCVIARMELDRRMRAPDRAHAWMMFLVALLSGIAAFAALWIKS